MFQIIPSLANASPFSSLLEPLTHPTNSQQLPCFQVKQTTPRSSCSFSAPNSDFAIYPKGSDSFQWEMTCRDHNLGATGAHCYWLATVSRLFRGHRKCFLIKILSKRINTNTYNANLGLQGIYLTTLISYLCIFSLP